MDAKDRIATLIEENADDILRISDTIWEYGELRFASPKSADILAEAARRAGFRVTRGLADMEHAFAAEWGEGGPRIGILGEYDALANLSQAAGVAEKHPLETGAPGHGCGHNMLGAAALAAAIAVRKHMEETGLKGTIVLFGCPAEESGYGKAFMTRAGVFDNLDAALTWHPMDYNGAWTSSSLAVIQAYFSFKGVSAHAAVAPDRGRSALDAAELMNIGVNFLREHIMDAARVHYAFVDAGGESPNVVQPTAKLHYLVRAPKMEDAKDIFERVTNIARGAALMTDTEMRMEWDSACADYRPNQILTRRMDEHLRRVLPLDLTPDELAFQRELFATVGDEVKRTLAARIARAHPDWSPERVKEAAALPIRTDVDDIVFDGTIMPASTDVGDVSRVVPTAQFVIACEPQGTPPHSWQWVANGKSGLVHKAVLAVGKTLALTALDLMREPELLAEAAREHREALGGEKYVSPIPTDVKPR